MEINNIVVRISYNKDIIFKIKEIKENIAILEGVYVRLIADAFLDDLELVKEETLREKNEDYQNYYEKVVAGNIKKVKHLSGKILHLDGDSAYLEKCLQFYRNLGLYAYGLFMPEAKMIENIDILVSKINPDIVVITGHDSYNKKGVKDLSNYKNTSNFIEVIKKIRNRFSIDNVCIIAGACQSNFEALIAAGANFATSPKRINVDALDPAITAVKVSITPFNQIVDINEIFKYTIVKEDGIGGIETYGKLRLLL